MILLVETPKNNNMWKAFEDLACDDVCIWNKFHKSLWKIQNFEEEKTNAEIHYEEDTLMK